MSKPHTDVKAFRTSRGDVEARIYRDGRFVAAVRESDADGIESGRVYLELPPEGIDAAILDDDADLLMVASVDSDAGGATLFRWSDQSTETLTVQTLSARIHDGKVVPVEQAGGSADIDRLGPNRTLV